MRKDYAKKIAKLLRNNGISCGNIKGNGSTSPADGDKYDSYFVWEPGETGEGYRHLYLNYKMDGKTGGKIVEILQTSELPYIWDGNEASCIKLAAMEFEICKRCKRCAVNSVYVGTCKGCIDKIHLEKKLWKDYSDCSTKDKKGPCDDKKCKIHGR